MASTIAKFGGRYLIWSSVTDQPATSLMTLDELKTYHLREYGYKGYRELEERLERVERFGTSSRVGTTIASLLAHNHAGPNGETVTSEDEMVRLYGGDTVEHWHSPQERGEELDPAKPLELVDRFGHDPVRMPVVEILNVREGTLFGMATLADSTVSFPVLVRLEDGQVLNVGFEFIAARNVQPENDNAD
jgi:hypothetical protein